MSIATPLVYLMIFDGAAGRFEIDGQDLQVAANLVPPGVYSVTVRATHTEGWVSEKVFQITVTTENALLLPTNLYFELPDGSLLDLP